MGMNSTLFYNNLKLSERTKANYIKAINSSFLKGILYEKYGTDDLFNISNLDLLWDIYSFINLHPVNIVNHREYSAAIMKYIMFLNHGKKYGRRIDYKEKRNVRMKSE